MLSDALAVECRGVEWAPPGLDRPVLSDFSLQIAPGEIVVLLGESGSGKTTALRLINGLTMPNAGEVGVEGRATSEWNAIELRRHIGFASQDDGLFPHFSVAANVAIVPELLGWEREEIARRAIEMLELVGLPPAEFAHLFPAQLSGEQRQRVAIARALAADQTILLVDEPFGRLDPLAREKLRDDFARICRELNKTAVIATRDLRDALLLGDKIALLQDGKLAFFGTPQEFALAGNLAVTAYRATMDLPDWTAENEEKIKPSIIAHSGAVAAVKEPGLRAKLKRAGKRIQAKF